MLLNIYPYTNEKSSADSMSDKGIHFFKDNSLITCYPNEQILRWVMTVCQVKNQKILKGYHGNF